MSPERTGEDWSPADAPDWFEAEENGEASGDPSTGENDWLDDVAAEGWFDDPDHRPIDAGTGATDEPAEPDAGDVFDEEGSGSDETAGAAESTGPAGPGTSEPRKPDAATADEPGTGADRGGTPENTSEAAVPSSRSDDGGTGTPGGDEGETGERDDRGTTTDERTADETGEVEEPGETGGTAEIDGTAETEDAGSYLHRVLAWLRSLVGRFA